MSDTENSELADPVVSIVVPARNEAASLPALIAEVRSILSDDACEIIVIDDGSNDDTRKVVEAIIENDPYTRLVQHEKARGKSAAVWTGVAASSCALVCTLDGDGQNDPAYLPPLIAGLDDGAIGLVAGQRTRRHDGAVKKLASKLANSVRSTLLGDGTRDTACGLKAFRRDAFLAQPYFAGMHRFLPALFAAEGWQVAHVDVIDRPRRHGQSKYGVLDRLFVGVVDLFGVMWLIRRRRKHPRNETEGRPV